MKVFIHHIYEYQKGLRRLVLYTASAEMAEAVMSKLDQKRIDYLIEYFGNNRMNVFFGDSECLNVLRSFPHLNLSELTDEQDFILGVLLGYDLKIQCNRYLKRVEEKKEKKVLA